MRHRGAFHDWGLTEKEKRARRTFHEIRDDVKLRKIAISENHFPRVAQIEDF